MAKDLRMYILVNEDIVIHKGKLAGQVGHAVAVYFYQKGNTSLVDEYMNNFQKKIILYAKEELLQELEADGFISIRDKGWTDLEPDTLTCVNLGILDFNNIPTALGMIKRMRLVK